jgi:hypothetical protein
MTKPLGSFTAADITAAAAQQYAALPGKESTA